MSLSPLNTPINERAQFFLKALVERYIESGQPIGSRTLAREARLDLSPATIRNVMADLEELGLIVSPHTSSGRIPTVSGYRMFVDSLLTVQEINNKQINQIKNSLNRLDNTHSLLNSATDILSGVTHLAGMVMLPRHTRECFRHIEFLPMSNNRVLVILVTEQGEVHNRMIHPKEPIASASLEQAANFLNSEFVGKDIREIRELLLDDMSHIRSQMDEMMLRAIHLARDALDENDVADDLLVSGQTNLMQFDEMGGNQRLRELFEAFNEQQHILYLVSGRKLAIFEGL